MIDASSQWTSQDWPAFHAQRTPGAEALSSLDTGVSYTWSVLNERVGRAAGLLADTYGVAAGDRIAVIAENDPRIFELQFACIRLGAILAPLNWRLALAELAYQLGDLEPTLLVCDDRWREVAEDLSQMIASGLPILQWETSPGPDDIYEKSMEHAPSMLPRMVNLDDPTHVLYTSGTTGVPKGALSTFGTMTSHAANVADLVAVSEPGARVLVQQPLFHAGGLHTVANPALYFGGCVVTSRRFVAEQCLDLMLDAGNERQGITHFIGVWTMFNDISQLPKFQTANFCGMRHGHLGGSAPPREFFELWADRGLIIQQFYGGTEMGPAITGLPRAHAIRKSSSCGLPVRHSEVRVVDPDGKDVAKGETGEVWVRGPSVTPGYWRRAEQHDEFFTDGFFRTGDAARVDEEGFYYIVGRYKDMYKSGGENVYAAEVEKELLSAPGVSEVAIIGVPDARWGEVGRAVVVARPGEQVTLDGLVQHCEGRLARYKFPKSLVVVDSLPRNPTGKVIKAEIRALFGAVEEVTSE
jgi:fatty-acyl-CoA synthase